MNDFCYNYFIFMCVTVCIPIYTYSEVICLLHYCNLLRLRYQNIELICYCMLSYSLNYSNIIMIVSHLNSVEFPPI